MGSARLRRAVSPDCPVPCGWDLQLCCAENQVCYTDTFDQAQCSSTAVETMTTIVTSTSTILATESSVTKTATLTSQTPSAAASSSPSPPAEPTSGHHGLSAGSEAAIAISVIVAVALVAWLFWWFWRRRAAAQSAAGPDPTNVMTQDNPDDFTIIERQAQHGGHLQEQETAYQPPRYESGSIQWDIRP